MEIDNELMTWDQNKLSQDQQQVIQELLSHSHKLLIQLVDSANQIQGIIVGAPSMNPSWICQCDQSEVGAESVSQFNPLDGRYTAHFMWTKVREDGVTQPDMVLFYVMRSTP